MNKHLLLSPHRSKKPDFYYGYIVVVAAFCVLAILHGALNSFGVFLKPMSVDFGWSRAMTSGALSVCLFLLGLLYMVTGRLSDKFGPRIVMTTCGFIFGLGYLLMSQVSTLWQLYLLYGVMVAIGMSGGFVPVTSTVTRWFVKKRGLMTGIAASGVGAGVMVGPPVSVWLISSYGWRTTYLVIGIITLVLLTIAAQFLRREPCVINELSIVNSEATRDVFAQEVGGYSFKEVVRIRQFWMLFVIYACFGSSLMVIMVHIVPHATDLGISTIMAANILTIIGALNIAGRIGMGSASDRVGSKRSLITSSGLTLVALLLALAANELPMFYLLAVIFGFGFGGIVALIAPAVAELFGLRMHGAIMGAITFAFAAGCGVGPIMAGHIFDITGSYYLAFIACIALCVVGLILAFLLKPIRGEGFNVKGGR